MPAPRAIILLSGGLDSATTLALAQHEGYLCHALSFDYGQRHKHELTAAAALANHYHVAQHITLHIDLRAFGGSALTANLPVPKDNLPATTTTTNTTTATSAIPLTYVPARNTVFLSFALAFAETTNSSHIFLGVNAIDYSGYPDCRPEFIAAFQNLANLATRSAVEGQPFHLHTPLIHLSKADIIRTGLALKVPYELTHSCYDPTADGKSCGHCDACLLRLEGFKQAGAKDPLQYA